MFREDLFSGQRILVTGGGTGLGRAMAEQFLRLGGAVALCGRRAGVLEETASALVEAHGGRVDAYRLDIRDPAAVVETIDAIWADGPLTGLVNNAGANFISRTEDLSHRGFDAVAAIVMHGTFYVTHAVGKRWIAEGRPGNVVSILTTGVRTGGPFATPSVMSKAAIESMTRSLAAEWGRYRIRLNAIAPGAIPTEGMSDRLNPGESPAARTAERNPMGRCGETAELQNLAAFLMSGGCDWLSGETIVMDGAQALATGANFFHRRAWGDEEWRAARAAIDAANARDRQGR